MRDLRTSAGSFVDEVLKSSRVAFVLKINIVNISAWLSWFVFSETVYIFIPFCPALPCIAPFFRILIKFDRNQIMVRKLFFLKCFSLIHCFVKLALVSLNIFLIKWRRLPFWGFWTCLLSIVSSELIYEQSVFHPKMILLSVFITVQLNGQRLNFILKLYLFVLRDFAQTICVKKYFLSLRNIFSLENESSLSPFRRELFIKT